MCWLIALAFFVMFPIRASADEKPEFVDDPPTYFKVYAKDGGESFTAWCKPKRTDTVTCDFMGLRFNPPNQKDVSGELQRLTDLRTNNVAEYDKEATSFLDSDDREKMMDTIQHKIDEATTGTKTKAFLREMLAAYSSGDPIRFITLMDDKQKRTCGTFTQTFSLDFTRIGIRKWLSDPGPSGLCRMMKVYELTGEGDLSLLWTLTETRVTAGDTESPLCKGVKEELNQPIVWSWKSPGEFELPCDFISHNSK
ncbi:MAG: hypothetical protein ACT4OO_08390 [Nitrospiraceae bacterium]